MAESTTKTACAYCGIKVPLYWTGRRWLCPGCYEDALGTAPGTQHPKELTNG